MKLVTMQHMSSGKQIRRTCLRSKESIRVWNVSQTILQLESELGSPKVCRDTVIPIWYRALAHSYTAKLVTLSRSRQPRFMVDISHYLCVYMSINATSHQKIVFLAFC